MAIIAILAFISAVYPLIAFVNASLDNEIFFGVYYYRPENEELKLVLNVINNSTLSLDDFCAEVILNASGSIKDIILYAGDVGPDQNITVTKTLIIEEFTVELVTFNFTIDGLYPLKVTVYGQ